jgi:hypothetical protein
MPTEGGKVAGGRMSRLSGRQLRDLAQIAVAGVVSTLFLALPVVIFDHTPATRRLPANPPEVQQPPAAPRVAVVTNEVAAAVTTPVLEPATRTVRRRPAPRPERLVIAAAATRKPFFKRLTRLLTGNGQHDVRPFPRLTTPRQDSLQH